MSLKLPTMTAMVPKYTTTNLGQRRCTLDKQQVHNCGEYFPWRVLATQTHNNQHAETASGAGPTKPGKYSPWRVLANFDNVKINAEDYGHSNAYIHVEGENAMAEEGAEGLGMV